MKASMFKYKTQLYEINHLIETAHIQKAMEDGTYKPEPGLKFSIKERGHARYITSAATADKAVNHITCDEYLTPLLQKSRAERWKTLRLVSVVAKYTKEKLNFWRI